MEGKDFSRKVTPLFATMRIQAPEDMGEEDMFKVNDLDGNEVVVDVSASVFVDQSVKVVEKEVSTADPVTTAGIEVTTATATPQITNDELTLAQILIEIKAAKPKAI
nr:hypothetical protein [Tanacetum cinerariifolium]